MEGSSSVMILSEVRVFCDSWVICWYLFAMDVWWWHPRLLHPIQYLSLHTSYSLNIWNINHPVWQQWTQPMSYTASFGLINTSCSFPQIHIKVLATQICFVPKKPRVKLKSSHLFPPTETVCHGPDPQTLTCVRLLSLSRMAFCVGGKTNDL